MSSERRWHLAGAFLLPVVLGCHSVSPGAGEREAKTTTATIAVVDVAPTIDATLTLRALDGAIELRREQLARSGITWFSEHQLGSQLVEGLLTRGHFLATVSDYDEALRRARELVARHGHRKPRVHLLEARALAALHRFDESESALDAARVAGVPEADLRAHQATIALARGNPGAAIDALREHVGHGASVGDVGNLAVAYADDGRIELADETFRQALRGRLKGDPLPVARIWFHQGLMWERQDEPARAARYYTLAFERFPHYAPLVSHLAALDARAGRKGEALARLRGIIDRSEDPEHWAQLASLLDGDEARELRARADAGYQRLLAVHPLAFADHAARYYLATDRAALALELAMVNLDNRESDGSLQLYLDAARAASEGGERVCTIAGRAAARPRASAYLLFAASRALAACGADADATAAMSAARRSSRLR